MTQDRDAMPLRERDPEARAADHAAIERVIDGLMPALVAKLGTLDVGELEVREGDVRVRLRRPHNADAAAGANYGRRSTDRPGGRGHAGDTVGAPGPAARAGAATHGPTASGGSERNGATGPSLTPVGPGPDGVADAGGRRTIAASPAVGVFQPGSKAASGTRVKAGDRLGAVDMLGVPHDVLAPADGIVVATLVEAGTAVEYGQELFQLEPSVAVEAH